MGSSLCIPEPGHDSSGSVRPGEPRAGRRAGRYRRGCGSRGRGTRPEVSLRFRYRAASPDGSVMNGALAAQDQAAAVAALARDGLYALDLRPEAERRLVRPIPPRQLAAAFRGLATL